MIVDGGGDNVQKHSNDSNVVDEKCEEMKMNVVEIVEEEDKGEGEFKGMKSNEDNKKTNENVSEVIVNNSGNVTNSEEEYEVVTGIIKKLYTKKKPWHYFGWFDSMF
jgi:hypothetical protein